MKESSINTAKPSICFASPNNYTVLSGRSDLTHIGGAEIQQPMIARELLRRGYSVSFITLDHGQPDRVVHDGIEVYKMCSPRDGVPIVRFLHPRWTSLWKAMSRASASVYFQMNNGNETGQAAMWCRIHHKHFVFIVSSDTNCKPALPGLPTRRERVLYRYGLRHADAIIAQTRTQQQMLKQWMQLDSVVIPSCSLDPYDGTHMPAMRDRNGQRRLLWVGRFSPEKCLERFLDVADALPNLICDVVGTDPADSTYSRTLTARATRLPNVTLHGRVPHGAIGAFYERASLLLCTSEFEGFPNTFMEAWARGVPTVTTVDPDEVVAVHGLGRVASARAPLVEVVRDLLECDSDWKTCSQRARAYYLTHHTIRATADAFEALLDRLGVRATTGARA